MNSDYQRVVEYLRDLRQGPLQSVTDEIATAAADYAALCTQANERLRKCSTFLQQGLRSEAIHLADESPNPEQLYAGTELGDRVSKKLAEISPLLRTAFWLREIEGLSAEEAAQVLGVSRNTLKARLWRARQELAARLGLALDGNLAPAT